MEHRSLGMTYNCNGCRWWSEMIARAIGAGPVQALCLVRGGPNSGKYCHPQTVCDKWERGHLGAVDEPCEDPMRYGNEERATTVIDGSSREFYGHTVDLSPDEARRAIRTSEIRQDGEFCRIKFQGHWWEITLNDLLDHGLKGRPRQRGESMPDYVTMFSSAVTFGVRLKVEDHGRFFAVVDRRTDG